MEARRWTLGLVTCSVAIGCVSVNAQNAVRNRDPAWSPDGSKIAFTTTRDGNAEIYVMDADGSHPVNLSNNPATDVAGVWSHDGSKIAFVSNRRGEGGSGRGNEIYIMNADGSGQRRVTDRGDVLFSPPTWSPEDTEIAFVVGPHSDANLFAVRPEGGDVVQITDTQGLDGSPSWSPDGRHIAFVSNRSGNPELYLTTVDGTSLTRLTDNPSEEGNPHWSPDGSRIAFFSSRSENADVWVMNADGTSAINLTDHEARDFGPSWSPEGSRVVFVSTRTGDREHIFLMGADGSQPVRLTGNPGR